MSKYNLVRCEVYSPKRHAMDGDTLNGLCNTLVCMDTIEPNDMITFIDEYLWKDAIYFIMNQLQMSKVREIMNISGVLRISKNNWYDIYDRMKNEISDPYFHSLQIVDRYQYCDKDGFHWSLCVLKTFWIKIIQRSWKKIYKKRCEIMKQRMMLHHLRYRELHGRWPQKLHYLPSVYDIKVSF